MKKFGIIGILLLFVLVSVLMGVSCTSSVSERGAMVTIEQELRYRERMVAEYRAIALLCGDLCQDYERVWNDGLGYRIFSPEFYEELWSTGHYYAGRAVEEEAKMKEYVEKLYILRYKGEGWEKIAEHPYTSLEELGL